MKNKISNKLINEKSPYLLQHAHNPVDWYPWSEEAFEKARQEDKPIFLSIGYSTCHWCHVMEKESFEDEDVAEILNKHFVSIKVDREERPDVDSIYMAVCQSLTGSGGWPLTIFMTPDKKPFYAGTYFSKRNRYGRIGLVELLNEIKKSWDEKREELIKSSDEITAAIKSSSIVYDDAFVGKETVKECFMGLQNFYDTLYGGFGNSPKFPTPHNLLFLMRYYKSQGDEKALNIVENTLISMYKGGVFDHVGYGFSRYSTDRKWLVPHFEKMLYDNALMALAYTEAYQITRKTIYKEIAQKIFTYVMRDMISPEGGFYSAEDADSEGEEGKFYVWTTEDVMEAAGEGGELFLKYYDITERGNFEGKNIPNLIQSDIDEIESNNELKHKLDLIRKKLFDYREKRIHPLKDDKILTSWNGLMIAALSLGGRVFKNDEYIMESKKAADFLLEKLVRKDGRLLLRYREGETANLGYLDDYAFLIWGLIELYQALLDPLYLKKALKLNEDMIKLFWDDEAGGLYLYGTDSEELITRPKEIYDGAMPSGNSVSLYNMLRLYNFSGNESLKEKAHEIIKSFGGIVNDTPMYYTFYMLGVMFSISETKEILVAGKREDAETQHILNEINDVFLPFATVVLNDGSTYLEEINPFLKAMGKKDEKTTVYICQDYSCKSPITDAHKLKEQLS
ncbi:cellobiose 2-epimerase [Oxobacter pfennigii]|uniref:Cellobiose 2-epimerase n=1 Tax=Oxobacter pfennigii TaxID=36849 RepID=A0A0N8NTX2_9CLOT|nr:thioredoxin domain-containing protein [Oxobacter pfennigii]KPU46024.1 cellobiose 2-epimerase [Oxobacter pfennigii]